jgi:hypothetical protein
MGQGSDMVAIALDLKDNDERALFAVAVNTGGNGDTLTFNGLATKCWYSTREGGLARQLLH